MKRIKIFRIQVYIEVWSYILVDENTDPSMYCADRLFISIIPGEKSIKSSVPPLKAILTFSWNCRWAIFIARRETPFVLLVLKHSCVLQCAFKYLRYATNMWLEKTPNTYSSRLHSAHDLLLCDIWNTCANLLSFSFASFEVAQVILSRCKTRSSN